VNHANLDADRLVRPPQYTGIAGMEAVWLGIFLNEGGGGKVD